MLGVASGRQRHALAALAAVVAFAAVARVAFVLGRREGARLATGAAPRGPAVARLTRLTSEPGSDGEPSVSPDGAWFVYVRARGGRHDLYRMRTGGENPMNLTPDSPAVDNQPAVSPDGELIAFHSERDGGGLFVMGATGESVRRLTREGYNPSWTPDGRELLYATQDFADARFRLSVRSELWAVRVDTGERRRVRGADAMEPEMSPRGLRIVYWGVTGAGERDLFTCAADGRDAVALTRDAPTEWSPTWSPDGRWVYFSSDRGGVMNLWRVAVDERSGRALGEPEPVTTEALGWSAGASFVRGGRAFVYQSFDPRPRVERVPFDAARAATTGRPTAVAEGWLGDVFDDEVAMTLDAPGMDVVLVRGDGTGRRRLTVDAHRERFPRFSPDGSAVAFVSSRGGLRSVFTVRRDGSRRAEVARLGAFGGSLAWSPDGRRLAAQRHDGRVILVDVGRGPDEQAPEVLTLPPGGRAPVALTDWSPDGTRLVGLAESDVEDAADLWVYSLATGSWARLRTDVTERGPVWLDDRRILYPSGGGVVVLDSVTGARHTVLAGDGTPTGLGGMTRPGPWLYYARYPDEADVWLAELR